MTSPKLYKSFKDFDLTEWKWPHFTPSELACKCAKHCNGEYYHDPKFLDALEIMRKKTGLLIINSARRCKLHNHEVGGVINSMHTIKIAVDIKIAPHTRVALYESAVMAGFKGIGFGVNFIHLDIGERRRWTYPGAIGLWKRALGFNPVK